MLTEKHVIDSINTTEFGVIEVRCAQRIYRGDELISQSFHRHCLNPGDDLTGQDERVSAVANVVWTPEVIAVWQARVAPQG